METRRGYKYRIYPNEEQATLISKTIGCARLVYNLLLDDREQQYKCGIKKPVLRNPKYFHEQFPFLKEVDSLALANARVNLCSALKNYFESKNGKRNGRRVGFPKRHTKNKSNWRYTTNNQNGTIRIEGDRIKLPKLGWIVINLHRPVEGVITAATVECTRNYEFYVSLKVSLELEAENKNITPDKLEDLNVVGLDMSMSEFVVDSEGHGLGEKIHTLQDGTPVENDKTKTKFVRLTSKFEKKRRRLSRRLSKKKKGSANKNRARVRLANLDRRIANTRTDFCHKVSKYYAKKYDVIMLEDIDMQSMSKSLHLGKSVHDLGFGMFKQFLSYKCEKYDTALIFVDKWFASSKTCHKCGSKNVNLKLSDRAWVCEKCGCILDRDVNAALNLRDYYYSLLSSTTAGTVGSYACGDGASTVRETLRQVLSEKPVKRGKHEKPSIGEGEAPSFRWG